MRLPRILAAALFAVLAVVEVVWAQATTPVPVPERNGYGIVAFGLLVGLIVLVGVAVKLYDAKRKREDESVALQSRLSDAMLSDPSLSGLPITPSVHVPFGRRPTVIILSGAVPSPARREIALQLVSRVVTPIENDYRIEDRLIVDPRTVKRAA